jgi:hypothetical protein
MTSLLEEFEKDVIGKDRFGNDINSLGQTFASYEMYIEIANQYDTALENPGDT